MAHPQQARRRRISVELPIELLQRLDLLRDEWGLRSRGDLLERLLRNLLEGESEDQELVSAPPADPPMHLQGALVLHARGQRGDLVANLEPVPSEAGLPADPAARPGGDGSADERRSGGIDLPGFVQRRSAQLRRSLAVNQRGATPEELLDPLPQVGADEITRALEAAGEHWQQLYGHAPNKTVLEAAMVWLAQDIWTQSDQSDGRPFTWSLACRVVRTFVPDWTDEPASFARVMVMAGLLEDPFSASTLPLSLPTLIRRFVHRFRRRRRGTSFQTLEHTMTLQGALQLLRLPTAPGQRLTLQQIREAYRELALSHHPDAGGSLEAMRRLNEAYQLLKELYRAAD